MRLPQFDYYSPRDLPEALDWLAEHQAQGVRVLAGGTDLLVDIRGKVIPDGHRPRCQQHRSGPWSARIVSSEPTDCLIALSRIPELRGISLDGHHLRIGAMVTIAELERSPVIRELLSGLSDGAAQLGSPLVRNRGTYGGNLCNARPAADTAIPTLSLAGKLVLASKRGERTVDHDDFVTGPGETVLEADELLKEIIFDLPDNTHGSAYIKLANRKALEISVVGAAAALTFEPMKPNAGGRGSGKTMMIEEAWIALGSVAPKPLLITEAGEYLKGKEFNRQTAAEAARIAAETARPITDHRGGLEYRKMMVEVLVRRALNRCRDRALSGVDHEVGS